MHLASVESEGLEQFPRRSYGSKNIYLLFDTFVKGLVRLTGL